MGRTYTSMRGKEIDMEKMSLRFEKTPAVGNMKVNARGDAVDDANQPVHSKPQQVHAQYQQQVQAKAMSTKLDLG